MMVITRSDAQLSAGLLQEGGNIPNKLHIFHIGHVICLFSCMDSNGDGQEEARFLL